MADSANPAKYWVNVLKQRMASQGHQMKIHMGELVEIQKIVENPAQVNKDNDAKTLLELFKVYSRMQHQKQADAPPAPSIPAANVTLKPEQLGLLRAQIRAFRHITNNEPIPDNVRQVLSSLGTHQGVAQKPVQKVVEATVNKAHDERNGHAPAQAESNDVVDPYAHLKNVGIHSAGRLLIPSIMPQGIDPIALAQEREKRIRNKIAFRIAELQNLPANLSNEPLSLGLKSADDKSKHIAPKLQALLELKALRLLEKQKKLRAEVIAGMKAATVIQTAASRSDYRRAKKPSLREIRHTEKMEKQHRAEREKKEKQKQMEHLNTILQHGRDMIAHRRGLVLKQNKLGRAILNWHTNTEKEEQKRQERISKERIRALKMDDEEAYMKLIDKQKDTRLTHLLQQTNQYLDALSSLVVAQQDDIGKRDTAPLPVPVMDVPDEDGDRTDYYSIAHRTQEQITTQPSLLVGGTLKEYQIKGLEWMVSLYNNKLNGILADEMGLGKTIQTISLITHLIEKKQQNGPFLVIVPLSTITNWSSEFEKWAPSVRMVVYKGTPNQRRDVQYQLMRNNDFNVVLTTYEYIIKDKAVLSKIKWIYTIIDEGHRMKNAGSKLSVTLCQFYSSKFRLILTGTPLQNNLPELWALLNFVLPRIFNSVRTFDDWFNTPFANTGEKIELNEEEQLLIIKRLHKVLRPFLLRRLKKDVEKDLPDKTERVLKTPLSAIQQKLYSQVRRSGAMMVTASETGKKSGVRSINNTIMQLRKICNHPYVFPEVEDALNPRSVTDMNIVRVSGKFELLDRILPKLKATGHRVLIFFQMTAVMDIMEDFLRWKDYKFLRLDGSTKTEERSEMLKLFNDPKSEYFVFILSTRAGGLGLNLQTADTVIIFDSDWNPHQDLQAQDRAHRIGQTKEVKIFRLISANSVEETILARAQYKLDIDGKVIQAGKFDNKSTNEERDSFLRTLLAQDPEDMHDINDVDDDEDLNEIVARGEEELVKFREMDLERPRIDQENWIAMGKTGVPPRLMDLDELPEIYLHDFVPEQKDDLVGTYGRGQRQRGDIIYDDGLTEDQFARAVDNDEDLDKIILKKRARRKDGGDAAESEDEDNSSIASKKRDRSEGEDVSPAKIPAQAEDSGIKKKIRLEPPKPDNLPAGHRMAIQQVMSSCLNAILDSTDTLEDGSERARAELFLQLPSRKLYPDYYQLIKQPIAIDIIQNRIDNHAYGSLEEFKADVSLMFKNAMTYNVEGSFVYTDALVMQQAFENELARQNPDGQLP